MPRVLALSIRPLSGPDTRYRLAQYIPRFQEAGLHVELHPLLSEKYVLRTRYSANTWSKVAGLGKALFRRVKDIAALSRTFDAVWIGRELFPLGPAVLEHLLFVLQPKVILDIDDAIFLPDAANPTFVHRMLRDFGKFERTAAKFSAIVCGNAFLADYFRRYTSRVHVVPTVVPMDSYGLIHRSPSPIPRIGWIGTPTNAEHLDLVRGPLQQLAQRHAFAFSVVGLRNPLSWELPGLTHIPWELRHELAYFSNFDIGIMPLEDTPFTRGKCAFKLIQYMAAGIPVVASPVGSNREVVTHGENGFLADTSEAWKKALEHLLTDPALRTCMGEQGRQRAARRYSLEGHWKRYAAIIKEAI